MAITKKTRSADSAAKAKKAPAAKKAARKSTVKKAPAKKTAAAKTTTRTATRSYTLSGADVTGKNLVIVESPAKGKTIK